MTDDHDGEARRPSETVLEWLTRVDPLLVAASRDVDRTLIAEQLARSPIERVRAGTRAAAGLRRFRRVGR